jgi:preprotein translocase subunit SecB
MQASPVQTRSIVYRRIEITPFLTSDHLLDETISAFELDWNGIRLEAATGCNPVEAKDSEAPDFVVSLRLKIKNETGKTCPYQIDVEALGLISVNFKLPKERRLELATVNGLAIVYGAVRELVTSMTSRMEYGPLVLPGVNFQDQVTTSPPQEDDSSSTERPSLTRIR